MFNEINFIQKRLNESWCTFSHVEIQRKVASPNCQDLKFIFEDKYQQLQNFDSPSPRILLVQSDPTDFIASFLAAIAGNCPIFLGNPHWTTEEWTQVLELVQPDLIWQERSRAIAYKKLNSQELKKIAFPENLDIQNLVMIPTGGTSGKIRFAMHSWETLMASVQGFYQYFAKKPVHSYCILPLYHVSGLMQFLRSFTTEGILVFDSYKKLKSQQNCLDSWSQKYLPLQDFFISLVPTQLQDLLQKGAGNWLSQFRTVLLGGAPAWNSLLTMAREAKIPLAPTYGMTETASQIVTLKPQDFGQKNESSGRVLPHAKVRILGEKNNKLNALNIGKIAIESKSLCLGYYPSQTFSKTLITDDLGYFDREGYLHIIGRDSQKIITGGENVFPAEVEAAILATNLVQDICVLGIPDQYWGEVVTAIYVPKVQGIGEHELKVAIADRLSRFKHPKNWIAVEQLPRNTQGKLNRKQILELIA